MIGGCVLINIEKVFVYRILRIYVMARKFYEKHI